MSVWRWLSGRSARRQIERDIEDEILGHLELKARDLEGRGLGRDEAWAEANRAFGRADSIRMECNAIQRGRLHRRDWKMRVEDIVADARWAVRSLVRAPWFTLFATVTLAVGVAANTSIFSVANGLFFRSLVGVRAPDALVEISRGPGYVSVSHPIYELWRDEAPGLVGLAAFDMVGLSLDVGDGAPEVIMGLQVSGDYFDVLGTRPALGRFFAGSERDPQTTPTVAVLSHRLWEEKLGADPAIVGSTIGLNGHPVTVIGVAEPGFAGHFAPAQALAFLPLGSPLPGFHTVASLTGLDNGVLELIGRVAPGTDLGALEARLGQMAESRMLANPAVAARSAGASGPTGTPLYVAQVRSWGPIPGSMRAGAGAFFAILSVVVGLLLVVACLNVAGLLVARAERRRREVAIRMSLGAGRARLVRQLFAEALALSVLAGAAGVVLTYWVTALLSAFQLPVAPIPGLRLDLHLQPNGLVLAYSLMLVLATGLVFGLVPALRATRPDLVGDLKAGSGSRAPRRGRFQGFLVAAQMAGTIVLLTASGLFLRAVLSAQATDTGFDATDVHVAAFDLELAGRSPEEGWAFYDELVRRARDIPGVQQAAVAGKLPLAGLSQMAPVNFEGVDPPPDLGGFTLANQSIGPGYLPTMRIPILQGRDFRASDGPSATPVVIVNQLLADRMWPGESPIGKIVSTPSFTGGTLSWQVVGVTATAAYSRADEEPRLFAYFPASQRPRTDMILHVRVPPGAPPPLRDIIRIASDIDPSAAVVSTGSAESAVALFVLPQRVGAWVTGLVGLFGLLLGVLGVYALTTYRVAGATRELGIRMAIGASDRAVLGGVLRNGMAAPLAGGFVGLVAALITSRFLEAFLYGVDPLDPFAIGTVVLTLVVASAAANLVPAARAARLDPARVLRAE